MAGMAPDVVLGARRAGGGGTLLARYASNEPNSAAVAQEGRRVADGRVDLGAVPDDPGVGHQARPVGRVEGGHHARIEPAERGPEGRALAQDRRPRQARLERLEREPFEQLDVVVARPAPLVVVVGDHEAIRVGSVGAGPGAARSRLDHRATIAASR